MPAPPPPEATRWMKGFSGNKSGKPKGYAAFKAWCREHSKEAGEALLKNLDDPEGHVRNRAAEIIWSYAWGKPTQGVEITGDAKRPVEVKVSHDDSPERLADILRVMDGAGILPAGEPAEGVGEGADAETE